VIIRSKSSFPGAVASFVGAYDDIPNIVTAYSTRRLLTAYTGSLLRIRRSSDNEQQDFGYDGNGDLDTAAIATFVGGGSGFIVTWYDQSGGGYHANQATPAAQPLYVASGQNGRPVPRFDGNDDFLSMGAWGAGINAFSVLSAATRVSTSDFFNAFGGRSGATNVDNFHFYTSALNDLRTIFYSTVATFTDSKPDTKILAMTDYNGSTIRGFLNGTQSTVSASRSGGATDVVRYIGALNDGGSAALFHKGDLLEIVIANAAWSTADREAAEVAANNYWSIF
jgi:hypothetical protein